MVNAPGNLPPLAQLLVDLAHPDNNDLLRDFLKDPRAVMQQYGLSEDEQDLVLSGDLEAIQRALDKAFRQSGAELPQEGAYAIIVVWSAPVARRIIVW